MSNLAVAKEFFTAHLPTNLLEKMDLNSLKLEKQTFIDEAYKTTEADVVYSVNIGNVTAYLYLLCEQQTKVEPLLAFRLLVYTVRIMETHLKQHPNGSLPLVYPMVIYTGDEPWDAPLDIFPLFADAENLARELLLKPYQLLDVKRTSDDELRQQALSGLVAFVLKHRKTSDFEMFLKKLMPWVHEVELHETSGDFLCRIVLKYVIDRSPKGEKELLVREAEHYLSYELQGEIMTIAQQWEQQGIQKGIQKGIEQGMQQGMKQGEAASLKRLLQRRFGDLPLIYAQRIVDADMETLLRWSDQILDAEKLEDVFS
jgi:predicted transposase/invertase (TIGR01784 family)